YVTPTTRSEFLLGKQLPYIALGMLNFLLLCALSVFVFGVPLKCSQDRRLSSGKLSLRRFLTDGP
ncbi:hypothetical protein MJN32_23485, partial [Salmonella enterica subsp. enterica serovar Anatum]|nr:hypothetical protein [Salmonella enterica subsp. enterica serovar Anatum]